VPAPQSIRSFGLAVFAQPLDEGVEECVRCVDSVLVDEHGIPCSSRGGGAIGFGRRPTQGSREPAPRRFSARHQRGLQHSCSTSASPSTAQRMAIIAPARLRLSSSRRVKRFSTTSSWEADDRPHRGAALRAEDIFDARDRLRGQRLLPRHSTACQRVDESPPTSLSASSAAGSGARKPPRRFAPLIQRTLVE